MPYKDKAKQREAQRKWARAHRKKNPDHRQYLNAMREENKAKIQALKESAPCTDCGVKYPSYVMQYDHIDRSTKTMNVARAVHNYSWEKVLQEIAKCELVCANCHAERTYGSQAD